MDDLQASLRELTRQAEEVAASGERRMAEVRERAAQERSSSTVSVVLGTGVVPESVSVGSAWEKTIGADALGASLTSAVFLETLTAEPAAPPVAVPRAAPVAPRSLELVVEDVLTETTRLLASIGDPAQVPAPTGSDSSRAVTVTVRAAVEIEVDPTWSAGRSAAQVNNALGQALTAAREAWDAAQQQLPTAGPDRTPGLVAELTAAMQQLARPAGGAL